MGDRSALKTINTWPQRMADWLSDSGFLNIVGTAKGSVTH